MLCETNFFWEKLRHDYGKNGTACMWQGFTFPGFELLLLVFYITKVEVTIQLQLIHLSLYNVYDSFSAPIKWVRRGDESQSGQIVLKKVKLTYFDAYLWQTMWNHAKKINGRAHSCLKWRLEEIYNLIFEHLTYSAILVPNWTTWQQYFSWKHLSMEMIETFWGGKDDASLARDNFLGCQETLELLEKG